MSLVLSGFGEVAADTGRPIPEQLEKIWIALNGRASILAVLDNFLEQEPLEPWLPVTGNIHVLVTVAAFPADVPTPEGAAKNPTGVPAASY